MDQTNQSTDFEDKKQKPNFNSTQKRERTWKSKVSISRKTGKTWSSILPERYRDQARLACKGNRLGGEKRKISEQNLSTLWIENSWRRDRDSPSKCCGTVKEKGREKRGGEGNVWLNRYRFKSDNRLTPRFKKRTELWFHQDLRSEPNFGSYEIFGMDKTCKRSLYKN